MNLLSSILENTTVILILIIVVFAVIAIAVFAIRKFWLKPKNDKEDEEKIVEDDLDKYLEPINDEETQHEFDKYNEELGKDYKENNIDVNNSSDEKKD